jgi:molecular chaperone GrpE (heat shock protein)
MARVVLLIFVVIGFAGCKSAFQQKQAAANQAKETAAKIREANNVLAQSTKTAGEWTAEYMKAFNPQSRAQFPANRGSLQTSANKILPLLDEHTRLSNEAIRQYEQTLGSISDANQRKGMGLIVSALKKSLQADELFKAQMRLVSDESIVDEKTFNERFLRLATEIGDSRRETQAEFEEGRRLMGL